MPSAGLGEAVQSAAGGLCEVNEGGGRRVKLSKERDEATKINVFRIGRHGFNALI